jgi:methylene-fatty-acyl-phospholipid synthase
MSAPVTTGPYAFMNEPQYIGTTACLLGSALFYQSLDGVILTAVMFSVFMISVELLEKPHMNRLYAKKK